MVAETALVVLGPLWQRGLAALVQGLVVLALVLVVEIIVVEIIVAFALALGHAMGRCAGARVAKKHLAMLSADLEVRLAKPLTDIRAVDACPLS